MHPSWATLWATVIDLSSFFIMPMLGGYINATVMYNYNYDPLAYQHASLDTDYLYASTMLFTKDAAYAATGRPDFFSP